MAPAFPSSLCQPWDQEQAEPRETLTDWLQVWQQEAAGRQDQLTAGAACRPLFLGPLMCQVARGWHMCSPRDSALLCPQPLPMLQALGLLLQTGN